MIHFDIKTAFLNGSITEEIYMEQPRGYEERHKVCRLRRSVYRLKQASRVWNECFVKFLKEFDLTAPKKDSCVLIRERKKETLIIAIFVDDGLACSDDRTYLTT